MGSCCPKASVKENSCPEVVVPKVTFNVIENPVLSESAPAAEDAQPVRPGTPLPKQTSANNEDDVDEDESKISSDADSEQAWETVE